MPWAIDPNTGEVYGFSDRKMTADDYRRRAADLWDCWARGYIGGSAEDIGRWASISLAQAAKLDDQGSSA